jgi:hypothetical protein
MDLPATFRPTHDTGGLPGFPAIDNFAPAGTQVGAPGEGTLYYKHMIGWDQRQRIGGLTGYYKTKLGTYFLTHFGSLVGSGTHLRNGQVMGTVANVPHGWWAPHIHEGLHSGPYSVQGGGMTSGMGSGGGGGGRGGHGGHGGRHGKHGYLSILDLMSGSTTLPGMPGMFVDAAGLEASAGLVGRLNSIIGGNASMGARIPWMGDGGDFVANRPQLIGVGDKGRERVRVTPLRHTSTSTGRMPDIHINIEHIDASGPPGKIREMVRGEIRDAIADVAAEMDHAGMVPDEDIL